VALPFGDFAKPDLIISTTYDFETLFTVKLKFEKLGFQETAVLKDFIKDLEGNYQDLVLMVKNISLSDN